MAKSAADRARAIKAKEYISSSKPDFTLLNLDSDDYNSYLGRCLTWISMEFNSNQFKIFAIEWAIENGYDEETLNLVEDWEFQTIGRYAFILLQGGQLTEKMAAFLTGNINRLNEKGKAKVAKATLKTENKPTIRNIAHEVADEIQDAIILGNASDEEMADILMDAGFNTLDISSFSNRIGEFLSDWESNDTQCIEMREIAGEERSKYFILSYKNAIKIAGMVGENLKAERKVAKKSKGYAAVRAEKKVKNIKTKKIDTTYNIVSLPAEEILGAQMLLTFNTKTRRLGYYVASTEEGLSVKGATILNFDENKSFSKITRTPERDLPMFRSAKNARRIEVIINDSIKGVKHTLNGRLNIDTTILKVFK